MGSTGTVPVKDFWKMLKDCADGYEKKATTHNWRITYNGRCYATFPLGDHRKRATGNYRVQVGHIKHVVRDFGIEECAKRHFPTLF